MTPSEHEIKTLLADLARDEEGTVVPRAVEEAVMRQWDSLAQAPETACISRRTYWKWAGAATALAASLAAFVLVGTRDAAGPSDAVSTSGERLVEPYIQWLDDDPSSLHVLRLRATRETLSSMGVALVDFENAPVVDIELVVGADGAGRSVRQLPPTVQEEF